MIVAGGAFYAKYCSPTFSTSSTRASAGAGSFGDPLHAIVGRIFFFKYQLLGLKY
jgi:hypothetical protein